ncbi:MAG: MlaE family lipid ABC transporter permease subunit [Syntrophales bacterium]|nr:MlaE family lipid ABC transporter permease subunit [Syntrophales bacterium]
MTKGYRMEQKADRILMAGELLLPDVPSFLEEIEGILKQKNSTSLEINLTDLKKVDSAGALALTHIEEESRKRSLVVAWKGMNDDVRKVLNLIDRQALNLPPLHEIEKRVSFFEATGDLCVKIAHDFYTILTFVGELLVSIPYCLLHPRSLRWGDILVNMRRTGADALPIVGLLSLLIGLIMAFMSSLQLRQLGANIYVASLVGIAIVKELGPMMTAIIVAGRSGSSFAAEIGTMIVNEEVDALTTMGFHPIRFLAIPKIIATSIVVPLLTLYAMMFGILGGLIVGIIGLDITLTTYLKESFRGVELWDVITSLLKAFTFAILIAGIGCHRGFQVVGGAEAVGEATTSAVVTSIFLIIAADAAYAVLLHYLG